MTYQPYLAALCFASVVFATPPTLAQTATAPGDCANAFVQVTVQGNFIVNNNCGISPQTTEDIKKLLARIHKDFKLSTSQMRAWAETVNSMLSIRLSDISTGVSSANVKLDVVLDFFYKKQKTHPDANIFNEAYEWRKRYENLLNDWQLSYTPSPQDQNVRNALESYDLDEAGNLLDILITEQRNIDKNLLAARHYRRGQIFLLQDKEQAAHTHLQIAFSNNTNNPIYGLELGSYFLENNNHTNAESTLKQIIPILRDKEKIDPSTYRQYLAEALLRLGSLYFETKRLREAEAILLEALAIQRKVAQSGAKTNSPSLANTLSLLGNYYHKTKQYKKAKPALIESEEIFSSLTIEHPETFRINLARAKLSLAYLDFAEHPSETNDFNSIRPLIKSTLSLFRTLASQNLRRHGHELADLLDETGALYLLDGQFSDAESVLKESIKIRRALVTENAAAFLPALAGSLKFLAAIHFTNLNLNESEKEINEALEINRKLFNSNPVVYAENLSDILLDLASAQIVSLSFNQAEASALEAVKIRRTLANDNPTTFNESLAEALTILGEIYALEFEKKNNAETAFLEALRIYNNTTPETTETQQSNLSRVLMELSSLYKDASRNEDAQSSANQAIKILRPLVNHSPKLYNYAFSSALKSLGDIYAKDNRYEEARSAYNEALEFQRKFNFNNAASRQIFIANLLQSFGMLDSVTQHPEEADTKLKESVAIFRSLVQINHTAVDFGLTASLAVLGDHYYSTSRPYLAISALNDAKLILNASANKCDELMYAMSSKIYISLSNAYQSTQSLEMAENTLKEGINICGTPTNSAFFSNHMAGTMLIVQLGEFYSTSGALDKAEAAFLEATKINRTPNNGSFLGFNQSALLAGSLVKLGSFYLDHQQTRKAEHTLNEALDILRNLVEDNPVQYGKIFIKALTAVGGIYYDTQRINAAELNYLEALKTQRRLAQIAPATQTEILKNFLFSMAQFYKEQNRPKDQAALEAEINSLNLFDTGR